MLKPLTDIKARPFRGGCVTSVHKALLPFGAFSDKQNIRDNHPGFRKRPGQKKLHTTADSTNGMVTGYQFRKRRIDEAHFFVQMTDNDVLEATNQPPTVTTGAFGAEVHDGGSGLVPASWGTLDDVLYYSNGTDQHQVYAGTTNYIDAIVVFKGSAAPPNIPEEGEDYSTEATDGLTTTAVILDSLNTLANFHCVFICTPVPANRFTFTISLPNGTAAVGTLSYRKNDNTWADTSETDGTILSGATMGQTGAMTWTHPSDEIPCFMYGRSGFWYQWKTATQLDSEVEITKITYGSAFQDMVNVWDGVIPYAIEAAFYDQSVGTYLTFSTGDIEIDSMVFSADDTTDRLFFNSADLLVGVYVDVGNTPNTVTTTTIGGVKVWTGAAFTTVGTVTDGTDGLTHSGWITWPRVANAQPTQFQTSQYYSYWYYIHIATATLSSDVRVALLTMPYFDIEELGRGQCSRIWKDRPVLSFTLWPNYIYFGRTGFAMALNGSDYGIMKAGDGRRNKIVAMRIFHNELMIWQEERGVEGGCLTLIQGHSPTTFGKLLISDKVGTFSNKTVAVVDGVLTSTRTDEEIKDLVFFLSRVGVCATDGRNVTVISDDIQNYFDPTKTECIRRGYEDQMWLVHDSAFNVIRIGLVSGSSATTPNVFFVFDLVDKSWGFDNLGQNLLFAMECEAGSGDIQVLQIGGGSADGFIYQLNTTTNDVSTAIDSYAVIELNAAAQYIQTDEAVVRFASQAAGDVTLTITKNSISAGTKTLSMIAEVTNQTIRRHRFNLNVCDQNISLKFQHNTASQECEFLDFGIKASIFDER